MILTGVVWFHSNFQTRLLGLSQGNMFQHQEESTVMAALNCRTQKHLEGTSKSCLSFKAPHILHLFGHLFDLVFLYPGPLAADTPWCWLVLPSSTAATCSSSRTNLKKCMRWWTKHRIVTTLPRTLLSPCIWGNTPQAALRNRLGSLSNPWTFATWKRMPAVGIRVCGTVQNTSFRDPTVWTGWHRSMASCHSASPTWWSPSLASPAMPTTRLEADDPPHCWLFWIERSSNLVSVFVRIVGLSWTFILWTRRQQRPLKDFQQMVQNQLSIFINVICILLPKMPLPQHVQPCEL